MMQSPRIKFFLGGFLILAAVVYLIASSTQASAEYFLTIDELNAKGASVVDKNVRVSGAIIGDSISYDPQTLTLKFTVAHVPGDNAEIEKAQKAGVKLADFPPDDAKQFIETAYRTGWENLLKKSPKYGPKLRELSTK